jgi:putative acetyltransferase
MITIDDFRPEHAPAFEALNRAWLVENELLEPADEPTLTNPQGEVIDAGGQIFVALDGDEVIGTAGIVPYGEGALEIVKLAVSPAHRGQGLGRRLAEACLAEASRRGVNRVVLVSNSRLQAALRLYERLGFTYRPFPSTIPYATADVYMELELSPV